MAIVGGPTTPNPMIGTMTKTRPELTGSLGNFQVQSPTTLTKMPYTLHAEESKASTNGSGLTASFADQLQALLDA